jgi:hypothetical protein
MGTVLQLCAQRRDRGVQLPHLDGVLRPFFSHGLVNLDPQLFDLSSLRRNRRMQLAHLGLKLNAQLAQSGFIVGVSLLQ